MPRLRPALLPAFLCAAVLLAYAGQFGLGRWQVDEFRYFSDQREYGVAAVLARLAISPRPVSEALIGLYGWAVLQFRQPFIRAALALLWAGVVTVSVSAAWAGLRRQPGRLAAAACLGAAPMAFALQTSPVTELFYWPVAAAAYLPMLAGAGALPFLLAGELTRRRKRWCCAALLLCALSHEIGAALAIGFAMAAGLRAAARRDAAAWEAWWIVPAAAGLAVMAGLVLFRSQNIDLGADAKPYHGRLLASAAASLRQLPLDAAGDGAGIGLARRIVFAAGFALVWLRAGRVRPGWLGAFAFGLGVAAFFSLLAAYYHYGDLCCERQAAARGWLINLALILAAAAALARWPGRARPRLGWLGPLLLAASLLPMPAEVRALRADYGVLAMAEQAKGRTWASGLAAGRGGGGLFLPPARGAMLVHGTSEPVATYEVSRGAPDIIEAAGRFFGKASVTACLAWQGEKSFLVNGRFIPACPPHDGPPDIIWNPAEGAGG